MRAISLRPLRVLSAATAVGLLALALVVVGPSSSSNATPAPVWGTESPLTVGSDPTELAAGANGAVWVVDSTDATITQVAVVAGVPTPQTPIALASGSNPTGAVVDHDGNVWVGLSATGQVQQIVNVSGTWTPQSPIAVDVTGSTMNLTVAPDGSIWVAYRGSTKVQHIVESGGTWSAEAPLSAAGGIGELVWASNGTGWLIHPGNFVTALVDTAGTWSLGSPVYTQYRATWGAAGPDGTLLLSDAGCALYQFDPATTATPRTAWTNCSISSVAATDDSSLWTASPSGYINRWSVTSFAMLGYFNVGGAPRDLTVASDGSLWFVNTSTHKVQRLVHQAPISSTITSSATATFAVGTTSSLSITTSGGFPTPSIRTRDPLPYGVTLTDNQDGTATLAGAPRPGSEGSHSIAIEAVNGELVTTQDFTLDVPGTPPAELTVLRDGSVSGWSICDANSITSTAGANFWISSPGGVVLRYTTTVVSVADRFEVGGRPNQLTTASDGTVWFVDETANSVRSISLSGSTWSVDTPITVGSSPRFLTAGADGSVWVADPSDATVTQVTNVAGVRSVGTVVSLPGTTLAGLTTGADGSIWAADRAAGALIRISSSGGVWSADAPIALAVAGRYMVLASGPDGDIWVAFRDTTSVQSVRNVQGTWTAQGVLTAYTNTYTIARGPRGTMWVGYATEYASQLFEVNGAWVVLPAVRARYRTQIATVTDDGSMWWSDAGCALAQSRSYRGVAPAFTSPASGSMTVGAYSEVPLTASGSPNVTISLAAGSLPSGVSFTVDPDNSRAALVGVPSGDVGEYTIDLIADNGAYRATAQTFTLSVAAPPETTTTSTTTSTTTTSTSTTSTSTSTTIAPTTTTTSTTTSTSTTVAPTTTTTIARSVLSESQIAQLPPAPLASSPVRGGARVRIRQSGFRPREQVQVTVASDPSVVATVTADDDGVIDAEVDIPTGLEAGDHHLAVYGLTSGVGFSQAFSVSDDSALPRTGNDPSSLLVTGLGLGLVGAATAASAARRRPRPAMRHARR